MRISRYLSLCLLILGPAANATEDPVIVPSSLKNVTVYRSGAEMLHNSTVNLVQGSQELVVEGIANQLDINSVQVSCPAGITIMGVEFSQDFLVVPEVTARLKALQDSAERLQKELDRVNVQIETTLDVLEVLKSNRDIKGQQTGLSVAELVRLVDYYRSKSAELQTELALQKDRQKKLAAGLQKINNQIREEERKNTRKAGVLKLQLSAAAAGRYDIGISYITPNAWWTPAYDIRVDDIKNPVKVVYKARISQTTGIDWRKVRLSLSTSLPSQWGNAPVLTSWFLSYINPVNVMERKLTSNTIQSFDQILQGRAPGLSIVTEQLKLRGSNLITGASEPLYVVNGVPM
ncbi:MAG TPA: mucoidy inhibitor MuiA family protein, partial [Flavisolibacter sp.]|nr:mucoidy inhibitor MuiA family protein [Flavisolibacter sp.]